MISRRPLLRLLVFAFAGVFCAHAAEVSATALFTERTGEVGVPLQFQIRVTGARGEVTPPEIEVDGLSFTGPRQSSFTQGTFSLDRGASVVTTEVYSWNVIPKKPGDFTVPALPVKVDGQTVRTMPVGLKVEGSGSFSSGDSIQGEIILKKRSAYVGELLPMELRLVYDAGVTLQPQAMPDFEGEGFTNKAVGRPEQRQVQQNGQPVDAIIFRSLITPVRSGKLTLGPAKTQCLAQIPTVQRGSRRRYDPFNDPFNDPFFNRGRVVQKVVTAPAVPLEVKPLPTVGRPKSFSNAVGQFKIAAQSAPDHAKINSPITVHLVFSGTGNFERMSAPVLTTPEGWRAYPPSEDFQPKGNDGLSGTKTFDIALIPEQKKTTVPVFELSYFDPVTEKYVTLRSEATPLTVEGEPLPATPAPAQVEAPTAAPAPAAAPKDILGLRYDAGPTRSFRPLWRQPVFLGAQALPVLLFCGWAALRYSGTNRDKQRQSALRRERAELLSRLRRDSGRQPFYENAARFFQVETALRTGRAVETVDAAMARRLFPPDAPEAATIDSIFEARAEALYAGSAPAARGEVSPDERERVLAAAESVPKHTA